MFLCCAKPMSQFFLTSKSGIVIKYFRAGLIKSLAAFFEKVNQLFCFEKRIGKIF